MKGLFVFVDQLYLFDMQLLFGIGGNTCARTTNYWNGIVVCVGNGNGVCLVIDAANTRESQLTKSYVDGLGWNIYVVAINGSVSRTTK